MGSSPGYKKEEIVANKNLLKTTKPELEQYLNDANFSPKTSSLLKAIKQCFLNTWPGLIEKIINKNLQNQ